MPHQDQGRSRPRAATDSASSAFPLSPPWFGYISTQGLPPASILPQLDAIGGLLSALQWFLVARKSQDYLFVFQEIDSIRPNGISRGGIGRPICRIPFGFRVAATFFN